MMNQRPKGETLRDLLEAELERSLGGRAEPAQRPEAPSGAPSSGCAVVAGELLDTHHPHLPGRVLVRWWENAETERSAWLHHERHLSLRRGDRVLVTQPLGWPEWVVTGALSHARPAGVPSSTASGDGDVGAAATPDQGSGTEDATTLRLGPGQTLIVRGHDGEPLLRVQQGPEGPILELERDQVELKARRTLKLSAGTIEIAAGQGGVDIRTDGDAVVRAHAIRLN